MTIEITKEAFNASHRTHTGEIITGKRLEIAVKQVAQDLRDLGNDIRKEDSYAGHVTEERKDEILEQCLKAANEFERGESSPNFTMWQRLNSELTGECVALLA